MTRFSCHRAWRLLRAGAGCHVAILLIHPASAWVHLELVTVGNQAVENVSYPYRLGKYEITNAQYAEFLNSVANVEDPRRIFAAQMQSNPRGGITRAGQSGSYTYAAKTDFADKPVNFVSWLAAARFCNWLHNWQPAGPQSSATTEEGAYALTAERIASGEGFIAVLTHASPFRI